MSEHTYCDRCGMEIYPKFDLCGGCFKDWKNWLPRSTRPEPDLDAPVQAEGDEEWVEIVANDAENTGLRCRVDGAQPQWFKDFDWTWHDEGDDIEWAIAYRKGREVAQAEHEALREQVRALVGAVLAVGDDLVTIYGWRAIREAARRVQL